MKLKAAAGLVALALTATAVTAQEDRFGTEADGAYAMKVWEAMVAKNIAGPDRVIAFPYEGSPPHGAMLEAYYTTATIDGHQGDLLVKYNYGPKDATAQDVLADPQKHLGGITVMFRREAGYDSENLDWFWMRFNKDGKLSKIKDKPMAGRLDKSCIECHSAAEGQVFGADFSGRYPAP